MIEIKLKNPDTGQFEECSVSTLTTPRLINGVEFDGSKDIDINEKEVIISNDTPTDEKNKLWISGTQGVPSSPITVDWGNVNNKPNWTGFMPTSTLVGNASKYLAVNSGENAYEYKSLIWNDVGSKPSWIGYMPITSLSGNANKVLTVNTDETGYEYKAFSNVAGSNAQVMFNDNGVLAGSLYLTYDKNTFKLNAGSTVKHVGNSIYLGEAGNNNVNSDDNIGIGRLALMSINGGDQTVAIGTSSSASLVDGVNNISIGTGTLRNINNSSENTALGSFSGYNITSGSNNLLLGFYAAHSETGSISNKLVIESAPTRNINKDYLIEGDFSQRWVRFNGAVRKRVVNITSVAILNTGTATSGSSNSLIDTTKTFVENAYAGKYVVITGGQGVGQVLKIGGNSTTTLTTESKYFSPAPNNTSTYEIVNGTQLLGENLNSVYHIDLSLGNHVINLPVFTTGFSGSEITFIIKSNPNNNKLYISSGNSNKILPNNSDSIYISNPYFVQELTLSDNAYINKNDLRNILQPIKISTKDLVIDLYSKIYKINVATATTITFNIDSSYTPILTGNSLTIELDVNMTVVSAITWPVNITWIGGSAPTFGSVAKYRLVFRTEDAGTTWLGNLAYTY